MQRVGDEPVVFAENQSWKALEQVFAEKGKYSLIYVLFTLKTYFIAQPSMLNLKMTSHLFFCQYFILWEGCDVVDLMVAQQILLILLTYIANLD